MSNQTRITKFTQLFEELLTVTGQNENTKIIPNATVINAAPTDLPSGYIIVEDDQGFYIPAVKVPGVVFTNGDKVNILLIKGTEAIAMQQGTASLN